MLFHLMYHLIVFKSDKHQKNCVKHPSFNFDLKCSLKQKTKQRKKKKKKKRQKQEKQDLLHSFTWHCSICSLLPRHCRSPLEEAGSLHARFLVRSPTPHVWLQDPQVPHGLQLPYFPWKKKPRLWKKKRSHYYLYVMQCTLSLMRAYNAFIGLRPQAPEA
jgi:hypothetical protein